jgi:hypothetical protein
MSIKIVVPYFCVLREGYFVIIWLIVKICVFIKDWILIYSGLFILKKEKHGENWGWGSWHKLYSMHLPVKRMWFFCLAKIGTRLSQKWEISYKIASVFCFVFCFCFWFFLGGWLFDKTNQTMFLLLRFSQFELNQFIIGAQELSSFVRSPLRHGLRDQNHFCTRLRRDVSQLSINASFFKLPLTEANVKFELLTFC